MLQLQIFIQILHKQAHGFMFLDFTLFDVFFNLVFIVRHNLFSPLNLVVQNLILPLLFLFVESSIFYSLLNQMHLSLKQVLELLEFLCWELDLLKLFIGELDQFFVLKPIYLKVIVSNLLLPILCFFLTLLIIFDLTIYVLVNNGILNGLPLIKFQLANGNFGSKLAIGYKD